MLEEGRGSHLSNKHNSFKSQERMSQQMGFAEFDRCSLQGVLCEWTHKQTNNQTKKLNIHFSLHLFILWQFLLFNGNSNDVSGCRLRFLCHLSCPPQLFEFLYYAGEKGGMRLPCSDVPRIALSVRPCVVSLSEPVLSFMSDPVLSSISDLLLSFLSTPVLSSTSYPVLSSLSDPLLPSLLEPVLSS